MGDDKVDASALLLPPSRSFSQRRSLVVLSLALFACTKTAREPAPSAATDAPTTKPAVLTQHNNASRTGAMLQETCLRPERVASGHFGRLGSWQVDGQVYAQPLFVPDLTLPSGEIRNALIVATMTNNLYALDADRPGAVLWGPVTLGTPVDYNFFCMAYWWLPSSYNIWPKIGITSTPVIDPSTLALYVEAKIQVKSGHCPLGRASVEQRLFKIDLRTGKSLVPPKRIDESIKAKGLGAHAENGVVSFDPLRQLQRTALLLANDRVYLAFGSHQDTDTYHGWVMAFDAQTLEQRGQLCTTCGAPGSSEGGVWQAGNGLAAECPDADKPCSGDIFLMTGNGSYDPSFGDYGSSFVRLSPDLHVVGSFTPANYECLNRKDVDLGSAGPIVIPGQRILGAGKEGVLFVLGSKLGGLQEWGNRPGRIPCDDAHDPGLRPALQTFEVSTPWDRPSGLPIDVFGYSHVHGGEVYWKTRAGSAIYAWPEMSRLRGFKQGPDGNFVDTQDPGQPPGSSFVGTFDPAHGMPGGMLSLSADGDDPSSGIIWASIPAGDGLSHIVPGVLYAIRAWPETGAALQVLWSSEDRPDDRVGNFSKNSPATVVAGHVYLPTFSGQVHVYGLLDPSLCQKPGVPQTVAQTLRSPPSPPEDGQFVRAERIPVRAELTSTPLRVNVTMGNTGTVTWTPGQVWLDASGDSGWGHDRAELTQAVLPNQVVTFSVPVSLDREGLHRLQWRMVARGTPFGRSSSPAVVFVHERRCDAIRARLEKSVQRLSHHRTELGDGALDKALADPLRVRDITNLNREARQAEEEAEGLGCENAASLRRRRNTK